LLLRKLAQVEDDTAHLDEDLDLSAASDTAHVEATRLLLTEHLGRQSEHTGVSPA
jgi:hypothetical protein